MVSCCSDYEYRQWVHMRRIQRESGTLGGFSFSLQDTESGFSDTSQQDTSFSPEALTSADFPTVRTEHKKSAVSQVLFFFFFSSWTV